MEKIENKKVYQKTWFCIVMLIFMCPIGVFLIWRNKLFNNILRGIVSVIAIPYSLIGFLIWIAIFLPSSPSKDKNVSNESTDISESVEKETSKEEKISNDEGKRNDDLKNKEGKNINDYICGETEFLELYLKQNNIDKISFTEEKKLTSIEKKLKDIDINSSEFKHLDAKNTKKNRIDEKFNEYKVTNNKTNVMYIGEVKNNRPNGIGAIVEIIQHGDNKLLSKKYIGNFKDGYFDRYGKLYDVPLQDDYNNLERLQGIANSKDSNYIIKRLNGLRYEGEFNNGIVSGKGNEINYINLEVEIFYREKLEIDMRTQSKLYKSKSEEELDKTELDKLNSDIGKGFNSLNNPIDIFVGNYEDGQLNGKCKAYQLGKLCYDGEWKNNQKDGNGIMYFENSNSIKYKGSFKEGKVNGKGTLYDKDGNIVYSGKWKNGDYEK